MPLSSCLFLVVNYLSCGSSVRSLMEANPFYRKIVKDHLRELDGKVSYELALSCPNLKNAILEVKEFDNLSLLGNRFHKYILVDRRSSLNILARYYYTPQVPSFSIHGVREDEESGEEIQSIDLSYDSSSKTIVIRCQLYKELTLFLAGRNKGQCSLVITDVLDKYQKSREEIFRLVTLTGDGSRQSLSTPFAYSNYIVIEGIDPEMVINNRYGNRSFIQYGPKRIKIVSNKYPTNIKANPSIFRVEMGDEHFFDPVENITVFHIVVEE